MLLINCDIYADWIQIFEFSRRLIKSAVRKKSKNEDKNNNKQKSYQEYKARQQTLWNWLFMKSKGDKQTSKI